MLPPDPRETRLDRELMHLLEQANALSAMSHSGKWPRAQARAMQIVLASICRAGSHMRTILRSGDRTQ